jgi:phosphoenolpyruvate synthase/pyruvate phosphate dikinase
MEFKGISANSGKISAKLCIVHDPDEFSHCEDGDVVLLNAVKPNVALAKRAGGILAVHGGMTSHAAISARENNKPSVVGLPEELLEHIKDGDMIEVDGEKGIVVIK